MILALFLLLVVLFVVLPVIGMTLWAVISTIVVGLVLGALGRLIVPGRQQMSLVATVLAGLCGAIVGGFLGSHVFDVGGFATALIEIGIAALVVALIAGEERRKLSQAA